MGKVLRFLTALFVIAVFHLQPKDAFASSGCPFWNLGCKIGDYVGQVTSTGCWNDCDALSDEEVSKIVKGMCGNDSKQAGKLQSYISDSHCNECSNNVARINSHTKRNCEKYCKEITPNRDCKNLANRMSNMTFNDYKASVDCFSANVKARQSTATGFKNGFNTILSKFIDFGDTGCWFCPIFTSVFNSVNTMATDLYNKMRDIFLALVTIAGLAWLLYKVLRLITTLHGPSIGDFMTDLFKGLGAVMLIAIALKANPSEITKVVIDIPTAIGVGLSNEMMNLGGLGKKGTITFTSTSKKTSYNGCEAPSTQTAEICPKVQDRKAYEGKALSADTYDNMHCLLRRISLELITGMALGATIFDYSLDAGRFNLPAVDLLLIGACIVVIYFILYVQVAFKLVDLLLKMGFVVILLPLFIVCLATPLTRGYAKTAVKIFIGCLTTLICLAIFLAFSIQLIATAFGA